MPKRRNRTQSRCGIDPPLGGADGAARSSRDHLVLRHLHLVDMATRQLRRLTCSPSLDQEDLSSEGRIALITAADRYDPRRGSFTGYAFSRIKGAMIDAVRRDQFLPRSAHEQGQRVALVSIEKTIGEEGLTVGDTLVDGTTPVEEVVEQRERLAEALSGGVPAETPSGCLTTSELDVLRGAALGETAEETACRLQKSTETVKSQRQAARKRLGARSLAHAVFIARNEIAA